MTLLALACYLVALADAARPLAGAGMNGAPRLARSGFPVALAGLALIGFAARVAYALATRDPTASPATRSRYHLVANNLADGHGYVVPFQFVGSFDVRLGIGANPGAHRLPPAAASRPCSRASRWWGSTARRPT